MVLSTKVKLATGESATLHGHLKLPEVLNKRVNVIVEPEEDLSTPPGLCVLSTKSVLRPGSTHVYVHVQNTLTTPLHLKRKATIATCQAVNIVPKAEL